MVKRARQPKPTIIDPATSAYAGIGLQWPVEGSRGDKYVVSLNRNAWHCTCMGFVGHGYCKHITKIDQHLGGDHADPIYTIKQGLWDGQ